MLTNVSRHFNWYSAKYSANNILFHARAMLGLRNVTITIEVSMNHTRFTLIKLVKQKFVCFVMMFVTTDFPNS